MKKILCFLMVFLLSSLVLATQSEDFEETLKDIDLSELPKVLKFLLGKPKMNVEVTDTNETYGFKVNKNKITDFIEGSIDSPNYLIKLDNSTLDQILYADNPLSLSGDLYSEGSIVIEPQTIGGKIKFKIISWFI